MRPAASAAPTARRSATSRSRSPGRPWRPGRRSRSWRPWPTSASSTSSASRRSPAPSTGSGTARSTRTPLCSSPPSSLGLALTMVTVERALRGRARYHQALGRGDAVAPRALTGWRRWAAPAPPVVLLALVFALPVSQLVAWTVETVRDGTVDADLVESARNTVVLGVVAAIVAVTTATVIAYGQRVHRSRLGAVTSRMATVGYGVPGTVVAVAVFVPLVWFDRRIADVADELVRPRRRPDLHRHDPRPGRRLRRAVPRAGVLLGRGADAADQPRPRRRRPGAGRGPGSHPGRGPPPAARPRRAQPRRCWCWSR